MIYIPRSKYNSIQRNYLALAFIEELGVSTKAFLTQAFKESSRNFLCCASKSNAVVPAPAKHCTELARTLRNFGIRNFNSLSRNCYSLKALLSEHLLISEPKLQINFSKSLIRLHAFCFSFRFAILGKKTVGTRIDRVPNVIVAGVCLFNFALDQGEDPDMQEDPELGDEHEEDPGEDFVLAEAEGARLAQGTAHRQWLVERYCQN